MAPIDTGLSATDSRQSERSSRRDRLIDGLGLLGSAGFLAWLAIAWVQDIFATWADALLFLLFFLAMAGACLYRCIGSLRTLVSRNRR